MIIGYSNWTIDDLKTLLVVLIILVPLYLFGTYLRNHRDTAKGTVILIMIFLIIIDWIVKR